MSEVEWLDTEQVAARMKVHTETVRRWIRSAELRAVNLGSEDQPHWRVSEDDLTKFLEKRSSEHHL